MSGLGKGVVTSSIAKLLQLSGQTVSCAKIDPYLNYDAGTMNPVAHGEVFVTEDGGECDMDIGNYERFLNQNIPRSHNITTAQVYSAVIGAERRGDYLGACVQIIPHVTDEIKSRIRRIASDESLDMLVVECGGTVGDIESLPFLEALRQMRAEEGPGGVLFVHVTLAPSLDVVGEQKTKPTQHSVQELRRIGIQPDYLAVRSTAPLGAGTKRKMSMFTNVAPDDVLSCHDAGSIFQVPGMLHAQGIVSSLLTKFGKVGLVDMSAHWDEWNAIADAAAAAGGPGEAAARAPVRIAMVGKYVTLADSYVSVNHALGPMQGPRRASASRSTGSTQRPSARPGRAPGWPATTGYWCPAGSAPGGPTGSSPRPSAQGPRGCRTWASALASSLPPCRSPARPWASAGPTRPRSTPARATPSWTSCRAGAAATWAARFASARQR